MKIIDYETIVCYNYIRYIESQSDVFPFYFYNLKMKGGDCYDEKRIFILYWKYLINYSNNPTNFKLK